MPKLKNAWNKQNSAATKTYKVIQRRPIHHLHLLMNNAIFSIPKIQNLFKHMISFRFPKYMILLRCERKKNILKATYLKATHIRSLDIEDLSS